MYCAYKWVIKVYQGQKKFEIFGKTKKKNTNYDFLFYFIISFFLNCYLLKK